MRLNFLIPSAVEEIGRYGYQDGEYPNNEVKPRPLLTHLFFPICRRSQHNDPYPKLGSSDVTFFTNQNGTIYLTN